jgi:hypothetical protein
LGPCHAGRNHPDVPIRPALGRAWILQLLRKQPYKTAAVSGGFMKELITEEQADQIVFLFCILVTLGSLAFGFFRNSRVEKANRRLFWANIIVTSLWGPVIWLFWQVYNSIENFYGLDSLKALRNNFFIAVGIGAAFFTLYYFIPFWFPGKVTAKKRK